MSTDLPLHVAWFPVSKPKTPTALGIPRDTTWGRFCDALRKRREGDKDGPGFVSSRFKLEPDGRVRRLGANLIARTAVALDIETNKKTGEVPPDFVAAVVKVRQTGWAAGLYTSHSHTAAAPRYRIVLPLSEEIDYELPAVEILAEQLGLLGVYDTNTRSASFPLHLPSCPPGELDQHAVEIIDGAPIDAGWIKEVGGKLLEAKRAEQEKIAAEARTEAEARRQAKIAAGSDPDDSLIEKIRPRLDLERILLDQSYDKRGKQYRHPNSTSGSYGADIKVFGGVERVYSHNASDPLHRDNLPTWCGGVTALDAVDALIILNYGGNRKQGLHDLARRFGLDKRQERSELSRLLFSLIRQQATQAQIEVCAITTGQRLGLSRAEVIEVAQWVASEVVKKSEAVRKAAKRGAA